MSCEVMPRNQATLRACFSSSNPKVSAAPALRLHCMAMAVRLPPTLGVKRAGGHLSVRYALDTSEVRRVHKVQLYRYFESISTTHIQNPEFAQKAEILIWRVNAGFWISVVDIGGKYKPRMMILVFLLPNECPRDGRAKPVKMPQRGCRSWPSSSQQQQQPVAGKAGISPISGP